MPCSVLRDGSQGGDCCGRWTHGLVRVLPNPTETADEGLDYEHLERAVVAELTSLVDGVDQQGVVPLSAGRQ